MWFLLKLLGLILVCIVVGVTVLYLVAKLKERDPWVFIFGENAENRWTKVFVVQLVAIFIIMCFNRGPALWLPEKHPTPQQRSWVAAELKQIWYGTNVPASKGAPLEILDPTKPLPWRHGTWFWWLAFAVLLPSWVVFGCWAYHDDVIRIAEKRREGKRKQKEIDKLKIEHKHGDKHEHAKSEEDEHHFWKPDFWDIISIGEMIARFAKDWRNK